MSADPLFALNETKPYCVQCGFHQEFKGPAYCLHPKTQVHVVTALPLTCLTQRSNESACGLDGRWFEPRPKREPVPSQNLEAAAARHGRIAGRVLGRIITWVALGAVVYVAGRCLVSHAAEQPDQIRDAGRQGAYDQPQKPQQDLPGAVGPSLLPQMLLPADKGGGSVWSDHVSDSHSEGTRLRSSAGNQAGTFQLLQKAPLNVGKFAEIAERVVADPLEQFDVSRQRDFVTPWFGFIHCNPPLFSQGRIIAGPASASLEVQS